MNTATVSNVFLKNVIGLASHSFATESGRKSGAEKDKEEEENEEEEEEE